MGLAIYPVFETELAGADAASVDGKALAKNLKALLKTAKALKVAAPDSFCSTSADEYEDLLDDDAPEGAPEEQWFTPTDALATFEPLLEHARTNPKSYSMHDRLLVDLEALVALLREAARRTIRFRLSYDF